MALLNQALTLNVIITRMHIWRRPFTAAADFFFLRHSFLCIIDFLIELNTKMSVNKMSKFTFTLF